MKRFIQNFNNSIKKTIFKVQNKTNDKFQFITFNNLLKKKIFKAPTKINNKIIQDIKYLLKLLILKLLFVLF